MEILFCIPGGGTSSLMYMGWQKLLKDELRSSAGDPGSGTAQGDGAGIFSGGNRRGNGKAGL